MVRIVRRGIPSVVTWRRAQMVLLSAQGMDAAAIAEVAFASEDRVRGVIHNFNAHEFGSLHPCTRGGSPPKFTLPLRGEIDGISHEGPAHLCSVRRASLLRFWPPESVLDRFEPG
jgi:hypothetical protein